MASLLWDRLLETCCRRNASDILLTRGAPPMIRLAESWRSLQVPPVDAATIQALASEQIGENPAGREEGYSYADFGYGDVGRFRATAFGYPATNVLLISRYPTSRAAITRHREQSYNYMLRRTVDLGRTPGFWAHSRWRTPVCRADAPAPPAFSSAWPRSDRLWAS